MTATAIEAPVQFSPFAQMEIRRLYELREDRESTALRVGVIGGGCSGMTYVLDFDAPRADDQRWEVNGVPVVLDPRHSIYLMGMEVDYSDGLNARGFEFKNPNAKSTCGCGTSFSA